MGTMGRRFRGRNPIRGTIPWSESDSTHGLVDDSVVGIVDESAWRILSNFAKHNIIMESNDPLYLKTTPQHSFSYSIII